MTTQFNTGDKVRVNEACCGHQPGDTGTIDSGSYMPDDRTKFSHGTRNLNLSKIEEPTNLVGQAVEAGARLRYAPDPNTYYHEGVTEVAAQTDALSGQPNVYVRSTNGGPDRPGMRGYGVGHAQIVSKQYLSVLIPEAPKPTGPIEAGDTVRVKEGSGWSFDGDTGLVSSVNSASAVVVPSRKAPRSYTLSLTELELVSKGAPAPQAAEDEVTRLRRELAEAKRKHEADIAAIGERMIQEANDRDWCDEYDGLIEDLNTSLNVELPPRAKDFEVTFYFRQTVSVSARGEDDAVEQAREAYDYGRRLDSDNESESPDVDEADV